MLSLGAEHPSCLLSKGVNLMLDQPRIRIFIIRKLQFSMQANSVAKSQIDWALISAGCHALTPIAHILKKSNSRRDKILAFDPSGEWLTQWRRQFAALEIGHLRSPAVHHRDPNPYELRRFAENRSSELFPPEDLPGSRLFEEFCGDTIKRWQLGDGVIKAKVTRIQPKSGRFRLWFEDGKSAIARRVIVAAVRGKPHLPAWANQIQKQHPAERIRHSHQVDLRNLQLQGEQIRTYASTLYIACISKVNTTNRNPSGSKIQSIWQGR